MNTGCLLSIVTTSYSISRLHDAVKLLNSIKEQNYHNIEVLFVVESSHELYDGIKTYIDKQNIPKVRIIFNETKPGANACRNLGIESAKGDIIALVDDDVVLFPNWAEEMIKTYQDTNIIGVTGPALPSWENDSMDWFPDEFSWLWGGTLWRDWGDDIKDVSNVGGMNCSFRRQAFVEAGEYLVSLKTLQEGGWFQPTGEEVEFSMRVKKITGKRIVFNPAMKVYHRVSKERFKAGVIAKRAFRMGYLRHMTKRMYGKGQQTQSAMTTESALLRRIFIRLMPQILIQFFTQPHIALKRFSVCFVGLTFTGLGYVLYLFKPFRTENV